MPNSRKNKKGDISVYSHRYVPGQGIFKVLLTGAPCPDCDASGWHSDERRPHPCFKCKGDGVMGGQIISSKLVK